MESKRKTFSWLYFLIICAIVSCMGGVFAYVNAYFTASAKNEGNMTFHDIDLEINSSNPGGSLFSADVGAVLPGDTITLNNISVKNTGSADVYTLINFDVTISRPGYTDYKVNHWYNLAGEGCNVENPAANTTEATRLASNASKSLSLSYHFDRHLIDNTFKNGKTRFSINAVAIQTENLKPVESITNAPLIAAYKLLDEFYVPNSTNAVDYSVFETNKVLDCTTPTERIPESLLGGREDYEYRIYNFSIQNVSTTDNMNVFVGGADLLCIMPGNHELVTFLMNYKQGILPEGSVVGSGQGVSSFTLTSGQSCEFAVVTYGSLNITPTVKIYTEPQEDLSGVKNGLAYYPLEDKSGYSVACANPNITTVTIENTYNGLPVKEIAAYGFAQNQKIQSVTIGNNVETIGDYSFAECGSLQSVTIGNNVETIGVYAFSGCEGLTEIEIPESVELINSCAFYYASLSKVTLNTKTDYLWVCVEEPTIVISSLSQQELCEGIVIYGVTLKQFKFLENGLIYGILEDGSGYSVSCGDPDLVTLSIPDTYNGLPVKEVAALGFFQNEKIQSVTIGNNVETIGEYAFAQCGSLQSVTFGNNVETIGEGSFADCVGLTEIEIPNSVKGKLSWTFYNCVNLSRVTFETGCQISNLGADVFYNTALIEITIPKSITEMNEACFGDCVNLKAVYFEEGINLGVIWASFIGCENLENFELPSSQENTWKIFEGIGVNVICQDATLLSNEKIIEHLIAGDGFDCRL